MNGIIRKCTKKLLEAKTQVEAQSQIKILYDIFSKATRISAYTLPDSYKLQNTTLKLPSGYAVSPFLAARCLPFEIRRTQKFLQGIYTAINQLLKKHDTIEILYAGCGPYATLIAPVIAMFKSSQLNIRLLDIHQPSIDAVIQLIDKLEISKYFREITKADATKYTCSVHPQLIICEAMFAALRHEPQVEITLNLLPQLAKDGYFIPQNIFVDACMIDLEKEPFNEFVKVNNGLRYEDDFINQKRLYLGHIFEMRKAISLYNGRFNPVQIRIPKINRLALITSVNIFEDIWLENYESELTTPVFIDGVKGPVNFWYEMGERPEFKYEMV